MTRGRRRALSSAAAIIGLALFIYAVRQAGVAEILEGIRRVGWGLVLIIVLGGARFALRAQCWRLCVPGGAQLTFGQAFAAFIAGDAVGSVTPLGLLASEPTKVFLTRHHLATRESVASLTLENLIYSASVIAMIALGAVLLVATATLPAAVRVVVVAGLTLGAAGLALLIVLVRLRAVGRTLRNLPASLATVAEVAERVRQFAIEQPRRVTEVFLLDLLYHGLAIVEVFLTLEWLMGAQSPMLVTAVIFEALNRVNTVVFKFVPFRVGVDEAVTGALAPLVAVDPATGVALAVIRKVRNLFWAGLGLVAVVTHPGDKN